MAKNHYTNTNRKKSFISRIIYNQIFLAFLGLIIITLISIPLAKNISKRYKISKEVKELEQEIFKLESEGKNLKQLVKYLESDQFVEEQARLNLGLKKDGENVVVIKEKGRIINPETGEIIEVDDISGLNFNQEEKLSNPKKWWKYFFSK